jgi:hypothetical protein
VELDELRRRVRQESSWGESPVFEAVDALIAIAEAAEAAWRLDFENHPANLRLSFLLADLQPKGG